VVIAPLHWLPYFLLRSTPCRHAASYPKCAPRARWEIVSALTPK
jgi:hypothetical protein